MVPSQKQRNPWHLRSSAVATKPRGRPGTTPSQQSWPARRPSSPVRGHARGPNACECCPQPGAPRSPQVAGANGSGSRRRDCESKRATAAPSNSCCAARNRKPSTTCAANLRCEPLVGSRSRSFSATTRTNGIQQKCQGGRSKRGAKRGFPKIPKIRQDWKQRNI